MATFVLLPGAGSDSWYWHLVEPQLRAAGHDVVAVDLPVDDETAGLDDYVSVAVDAIRGRDDVVLVAQSLSAFVAPVVATIVPVQLLVLVAPMTPAPGESAGQWWDNVGCPPPGPDFDPVHTFLHDVPPDIAEESAAHVRPQAGAFFVAPWPLGSWPPVPTRFVLCRNDRLFPADLQRRLAHDRVGVVPDEIESGHLPALSQPSQLTELFLGYVSTSPDR